MKKFVNPLKSKIFWFNILGIIAFIVLAFVVLMLMLRSCTHHGEVVTVPTVVGMDVDNAMKLIDDEGFVYEIIDTLIVDSLPKGVVVEQTPAKESLVKPGRTIYLKINTTEDVYIEMPNFVDAQSKTLAVALMNSKLKMGNITYQKNENDKNVVLKQMYNGRQIAPGTKIKRGSRIDFVIAGCDPNAIDEEEDNDERDTLDIDESDGALNDIIEESDN